jgi:methylmalonyl-CoA/ethylmalonyl-CoA epimerase
MGVTLWAPGEILLTSPYGTRLHHVGFVVAAIQGSIQGFVRSLAAQWDEKIFHDPLQKVRVTFLQTQNPSDAQVELVEPAAEDSPILSFLQKGGGLHHLCYEVTNLDSELDEMRSRGLVVVRKPLPAIAFENRRIAWLSTKQKLLLEFLEARRK